MAETGEISDSRLQDWLNAERWFMRYLGGMLLVIAVLSIFSGVFSNPIGEMVIQFFNIAVTILLAVAGIWTILSANNEMRMQRIINDLLAQPANRSVILAVVQIIVGILFVLEGLRGRITFLLLGVLLFCQSISGITRLYVNTSP
jgi:uncharacterized membrane protein YidH (DUF202 family)